MVLFHGLCLPQGFLVRVLDDDRGCAPGVCVSVGRRKTEQTTITGRLPRIVCELEVDVPEAAIVADGRDVLATRSGCRARGFVRWAHLTNISTASAVPLLSRRRSSQGSTSRHEREPHLLSLRGLQRASAEA